MATCPYEVFPLPLPSDTGVRSDRRFTPTSGHPARAQLIAPGGFRTAKRLVEDISLGGVGFKLTPSEARRFAVPSSAQVELEFFGTRVVLDVTVQRRTKLVDGKLFDLKREIGVHFVEGVEFDDLVPFLERYLQELNTELERASAA